MMGPLGRMSSRVMVISSFFFRLYQTPMAVPTSWLMTVAMAAPLTPRAGKGPRPKISRGSRMMFSTAPTTWMTML